MTQPGASHRILVALSHAADSYVGIAQDTPLIFDMLTDQPGVNVAGLLMPTGRHDLPRIAPGMQDAMEVGADALHWMARNWESHSSPRLLGRLGELPRMRQTNHRLLRLREQDRSSAI